MAILLHQWFSRNWSCRAIAPGVLRQAVDVGCLDPPAPEDYLEVALISPLEREHDGVDKGTRE